MAREKKMGVIDTITYLLVVIGALNWGFVAIFNFNLVEVISLGMVWLAKTIYVLVGLSGLYAIWTFIKLIGK